MKLVFVGERRSKKAEAMGVTWTDGRLAAKQLFDALKACGVDPVQHEYANVFERGTVPYLAVAARLHDFRVIAMGRKAQSKLTQHQIPFTALIHPAARGAIRRKAAYAAHVRAVLRPLLEGTPCSTC